MAINDKHAAEIAALKTALDDAHDRAKRLCDRDFDIFAETYARTAFARQALDKAESTYRDKIERQSRPETPEERAHRHKMALVRTLSVRY